MNAHPNGAAMPDSTLPGVTGQVTPAGSVATGIIDGLPDAEYHGHEALSVSGARLLLPPSCPAIYRYQRDHGRKSTAAFDLGHAAHKIVLGAGPEIRTIDADSWRTKAAQSARDEAYAIGEIPLLIADSEVLQGMVDSIRAHPLASVLFAPDRGKPEVSLFWTDDESGVNLRGRLDWLPVPSAGRLLVTDLKTSVSADPASFAKSAANYGYHQQAAMYIDGLRALNYADDIAFLFAIIEKSPPYLVSVVELDDEAIRIGRQLNRQAIGIFAECVATGEWPGYGGDGGDVSLVSLPGWYRRLYSEDSVW